MVCSNSDKSGISVHHFRTRSEYLDIPDIRRLIPDIAKIAVPDGSILDDRDLPSLLGKTVLSRLYGDLISPVAH